MKRIANKQHMHYLEGSSFFITKISIRKSVNK